MVVLIVAALLRFFQLAEKSYDYDEVSSLQQASEARVIYEDETSGTSQVAFPIYLLILRGWSTLLGEQELASRSLSVLFSMVEILLLILLMRSFFDPLPALLAGLLLALARGDVQMAQHVRHYTFFSMLVVGSFLTLCHLLRTQRVGYAVAYWFLCFLALKSHPYAYFYVGIQTAFLLVLVLLKRGGGRALLYNSLAWLTILIGLLPKLSYVTSRLSPESPMHLADVVFPWTLVWVLEDSLCSGKLGILCVTGIVGLGLFFPLRRALSRGKREAPVEKADQGALSPDAVVWLLVLWATLPILLPYLFSLTVRNIFGGNARYVLPSVPPMCALVAIGCVSLRQVWLRILLCSLALLVVGSNLLGYYRMEETESWREATRFLCDRLEEDQTPVFVSAGYMRLPLERYARRPLCIVEVPALDRSQAALARYRREARKALQSQGQFWVVLSHNFRDPTLYQTVIPAEYQVSDTVSFPGIELLFYTKQ